MIDLHAHVLPGLDDGAVDDDMAVAMCRAWVADGVQDVVATPHLYRGGGVTDARVIAPAVERLRGILSDLGIPLNVHAGAEVDLVEDLVPRYRAGEIPAYDAGRRYVLLELPSLRDGLRIVRDMIFRLRLEGVVPILAHPERLAMFADPQAVQDVLAQGALIQVTAASFLNEGSSAWARAWDWVRRGWVHVVASDAHDLKRRPPALGAAARALALHMGDAQALLLTRDNPRKILDGIVV